MWEKETKVSTLFGKHGRGTVERINSSGNAIMGFEMGRYKSGSRDVAQADNAPEFRLKEPGAPRQESITSSRAEHEPHARFRIEIAECSPSLPVTVNHRIRCRTSLVRYTFVQDHYYRQLLNTEVSDTWVCVLSTFFASAVGYCIPNGVHSAYRHCSDSRCNSTRNMN